MIRVVERLERRHLLSASPDQLSSDLQQTQADGQSIFFDFAQCHMGMIPDGKAVTAASRNLPHTTQEHALAKSFRVQQAQWVRTLMRDYHKLLRAALLTARRAIKEGQILINVPTNTILSAKLLSDLQTLQQRATPALSVFLADVPAATSSLNASLSALSAANSSADTLTSAVSTEITDGNNCLSVFKADANTAQSDVATLIADLG